MTRQCSYIMSHLLLHTIDRYHAVVCSSTHYPAGSTWVMPSMWAFMRLALRLSMSNVKSKSVSSYCAVSKRMLCGSQYNGITAWCKFRYHKSRSIIRSSFHQISMKRSLPTWQLLIYFILFILRVTRVSNDLKGHQVHCPFGGAVDCKLTPVLQFIVVLWFLKAWSRRRPGVCVCVCVCS